MKVPASSVVSPKYVDHCCGGTATISRSDDEGDAVASSRRSDKEIVAVSPQPSGPVGVAAELVVARRRRCEGIDSSSLRDFASQAPPAMVNVFRRHHTRFLALSVCFCVMGSAGAQTADEVIARLQKKYEQLKSFSARFDQIFQGHGTELRESGTVTMEKPGKMYWEYQRPTKKFFVADGEQSYFYVPQDRQVIISEFDVQAGSTPLLFLLGRGEIEEDFLAELEQDDKVLREGNLLVRLTPKQPMGHFSHIILEVNPADYLIHRLVVIEPIGNRNEYVLSEIRENVRIPDRRFKFEVPAGVEVIRQ